MKSYHRSHPKSHGYTLLELLVVIAIIGIVAAVGFINIQKSIRAQKLREVQVQFAQTIERARGLARRYGYSYEIRLHPPKTTAPIQNYWFEAIPQQQTTDYSLASTSTVNTTKTTPTDAPTLTFDLPTGTRIAYLANNVDPGFDGFIITGPFGRTDASAKKYCFGLDNDDLIAQVDVLGVTGKAVVRAFKTATTSTTSCS
jgi:type IV pilus assembly protein PilA